MKEYELTSSLPMFPIDRGKEDKVYRMTVQCDDVSDGYHTMEELYEHRHRLFLALLKIYDNYITPLDCKVRCWKSRHHFDGSKFNGWFIAGMTVEREKPFDASLTQPKPYQISYHLPEKYWKLANVVELPHGPKWDGHTSKDVLERLLRL